MKLQHLTDNSLHYDTLKLVAQERRGQVEILHHLQEIDRRKLFSDYKCSGLFDYCVRLLGYSEASAQRRITAARLLSEIPLLETKIREGNLTLTNIALANQFIRQNEISKNEDKLLLLLQIENLSKKECEKKLFQIFEKEIPAQEEKRRVSHNMTALSIILSDDTLEELEKLKALLSRNLSMDELIKYMVRAGIEKVEREKFKQIDKPRGLSPVKVGRIPPASIKREIYKRDSKCVQCGSLHHLNYDHREAYALGGETSIDNMRLLCFNCNQRSRIKVFGTGFG